MQKIVNLMTRDESNNEHELSRTSVEKKWQWLLKLYRRKYISSITADII